MKLALIGIAACLAVTVSAGGAGGHGGNVKGASSTSHAKGKGGKGGKGASGQAKGGKAGGGGTIGNQQASVKAGGTGGEVINNYYEPEYINGNTGTVYVSASQGGSSQGGQSGSVSQVSMPKNVAANGGSGNGISGAAAGGNGGRGPTSGPSGGNTSGQQTGGQGGKGGDSKIQATVPVTPARRSARPVMELTETDIIETITRNEMFPAGIEKHLATSPIAKKYNIPTNRKPANPVHAAKDHSAAVDALLQGNIPVSVIQALDQVWPKKNANTNGNTGSGGKPKGNNAVKLGGGKQNAAQQAQGYAQGRVLSNKTPPQQGPVVSNARAGSPKPNMNTVAPVKAPRAVAVAFTA